MEFARHGQPAPAADGDDGDRRFPTPPPPDAREASPAPAQGNAVAAALARRREELLWELHKMKIRREMLICDLVETERAMAARFAAGHQPAPALAWPRGDLLPSPMVRDYAWHGGPSAPFTHPWEEAHVLAPRSSDQEPPWLRRSPSAVRTPVYPHVERAPSPMTQVRPADGDKQQECDGPSGSPARALPVQPALHADQQFQPLPGKEAAAQEGVPQIGVSGSPARALPVQPAPHADQQFGPLPGKEAAPQEAVAQIGVSGSPARALPVQPVPHADQQFWPLPGKEDAAQEAVAQIGGNADVKRALLDQGLTAGGQGVVCQDSKEGEIAVDGHALQLMGMNVSKNSEHMKPKEFTTGNRIDDRVQQRCQDRPANREIAAFEDQKRVEFNAELTPEKGSSGVKRQLTAATPLVKKPRSQKNYNCSLCQVSMTCYQDLVEHRASVLHRSNLVPLQSGKKTTTAATETMTMNTEAAQHAEKTQKPESSEWYWSEAYQARCTSENDPGRKTGSQSYFCNLCGVWCTSEKAMVSHLGGRKHREMALQEGI